MADYIEREALIDEINIAPVSMSICMNVDECKGRIYERERLVRIINAIPNADVVPVRHGRWEKATGMMPPEYCGLHICSECGHYAGRKPPYGGKEMLSDYCPNCGALMKNGDGE